MIQNKFKMFGLGLVGGVLGALLVVGGISVLDGNLLGNHLTNVKTTGNNTISKNVYKNTTNVTEVVKKVQSAVVSIVNLQSSKTASTADFGSFFEDSEKSASGDLQTVSEGSGVIYKKEGDKAFVVTNNHVVDGQQGLKIILSDGTKVNGGLVGRDVYSDLAVVKFQIPEGKEIIIVEFADSSKVTVGEAAIAIGSPLGSKYSNSATEGIVSAIERQVTFQNEQEEEISINAIQTDAAINPGNSGGPLLNIEGQVIGINSIKLGGETIEGMGFANSSNDVVIIVNQLEEKGKVERPALGIRMADLSNIPKQRIKKYLKLPSEVKEGIVVCLLNPAAPAEAAGLKQYDVIIEMDGKVVKTSIELQSQLYKHKIGDTVEVTYYRGNDKKTTKVKLTIDKQALRKHSKNE
ncbi:MAG: trypsin-like peptidase domain-containing protein [Streptococcaceae bacterium]|nr:trypsin-like peptidase domain-containing protein [Streptococcaceae bacterium]